MLVPAHHKLTLTNNHDMRTLPVHSDDCVFTCLRLTVLVYTVRHFKAHTTTNSGDMFTLAAAVMMFVCTGLRLTISVDAGQEAGIYTVVHDTKNILVI